VTIVFTPLREEDVLLVERWLKEEHVARWWREPVEEAIEKRYAGIRPTRQFLIVLDGRPAGLIQTYRVESISNGGRRPAVPFSGRP